MITAANRRGYASANVTNVITEAGVSRPTFYEYFTDRDDCFLTALEDVQRRLVDHVHDALARHVSQDATRTAIAAIVEFAGANPAIARFLMSEAMGAGARALDARDESILEIERAIEEAREVTAPSAVVADVSPRMVIGGVHRLLASRLRRGEPRLSALATDLTTWIGSYEQPMSELRWRTPKPGPRPAPATFPPEIPMRAPPPLPPGRPQLSEEQVAANHRQRILLAAGQLAEQNGYSGTTVAQITKLAKVDGRAFYALFTDKQDAFMTMHELGFQEIMAVTAGAFFRGATWPERSWEAGRAFTQFVEQNPRVAHVGFVEAYAVGPGAIQRVEDSHIAFTIFLQEGYRHAAREKAPSRLALEAIITTIFEIIYQKARASAKPRMAGLLGSVVFHWLTPFIGPAEANAFIDRKLGTTGRS
jgi:AcrR family transcriptional regulator